MSVPAPRGDHDVDGLHDVGDQGLENSRERSCPSSSKTSATAGLISAAGVGWSARGANVDRARAVLIEQRGHHQGAPSVGYTDEQGLGHLGHASSPGHGQRRTVARGRRAGRARQVAGDPRSDHEQMAGLEHTGLHRLRGEHPTEAGGQVVDDPSQAVVGEEQGPGLSKTGPPTQGPRTRPRAQEESRKGR